MSVVEASAVHGGLVPGEEAGQPRYVGDLASRPEFKAIGLVRSPRWIRGAAYVVIGLLTALPFVMALAPWQQTVRGSGLVVARNPLDRPQGIEAPISGRVVEWFVGEGSRVEAGDPLLRMEDIDPDRVQRLNSQLDSLQNQLISYQTQVTTYATNVETVRGIGELKVQSLEAKREQARQKIEAKRAAVAEANAQLIAAQLQFDRQKELLQGGGISVRDLELAERDFQTSTAKVKGAEADVRAAEAELNSAERELDAEKQDVGYKVNSASVLLEEAKGKVSEVELKIQDYRASIARQLSQDITAPRAGTVQRLSGNQDTEIVSAGETLLILVPTSDDRAVELYVDGNDAPLLAPGDSVRLQFEGWPAVQFAGWPSVAVGTFGGTVALIDPTDSEQGRFRAIVVPEDGEKWPDPRFLRQGVRAKGWVLLNEVTVGWELWRQLNGFPPIIAQDEPTGVARKRVK